MRVITHDGRFHADECMAIAILQRVFGDFIEVVRTRDLTIVTPDDIIVDVGHGELDHHQRGGNGTRENGIPYASAGLVWAKYGPGLIDPVGFKKVDQFIELIDAVDTGYNKTPSIDGLSLMIASLNPEWDEDVDPKIGFGTAVCVASKLLDRIIKHHLAVTNAANMVNTACEECAGKDCLILPVPMPWQEHVVGKDLNFKFVVFQDTTNVKVQTIPVSQGSREAVEDLPISWLSDNKPEGLVFCHPGRFIAGFDNLDNLLKAIANRNGT